MTEEQQTSDWAICVHLVSGERVLSKTRPMTTEQIEEGRKVFGELLQGSGGWQISIDLSAGGWAVFPKESVLYVELVPSWSMPKVIRNG